MIKETGDNVGSIIRTDNDSIWYCCGEWALQGQQGTIPAILSYVPDNGGYPHFPNQKTLEIDGVRHLKVFGQPIETFKAEYLSRQGTAQTGEIGRVSFIPAERIVEVRDTRIFRRVYTDALPKMKDTLERLAEELTIDVEDIGIGGSSLLLQSPVLRDEIDFFVYGTENSRRVHRKLESGRQDGTVVQGSDRHYQRFLFDDIVFDPQYALSSTDQHPCEGVRILQTDTVTSVALEIEDDQDGIFFPAVYGLSTGRRLISFRVGQRGLFRNGDKIEFQSLTQARIAQKDGSEEECYMVLGDEIGNISRG